MSLFHKLLAFFKKLDDTETSSTSTATTIPAPIKSDKTPTSTMVNSISLSTDMKTLYLIDNGRAIDFPLDAKNGILIGIMDGQVTVASAQGPKTETSESDISTGQGATATVGSASAPTSRNGDRPVSLKLSLKGNQWTVFFNNKHKVFAVIGATDIDGSIAGENDPKSELHFIDLKTNIVNVRRTEDALVIISRGKKAVS